MIQRILNDVEKVAVDWDSLIGIEDPLKRRLVFVGLLARDLSEFQIVPIVVGGNALEFYTLGGYTTQDIDLVCSDPEKVGLILQQHNFRKEGRHWINEELLIAVEVPATSLLGSHERLERIEIDDLQVTLISKEDLTIDRLNACVHWKSDEDCRWVLELLFLYEETLDWKYLESRATKNEVITQLKDYRSRLAEMQLEKKETEPKR
ncbi:MAG: DUF6036 family nucleotidyltransferase [Candidatus Heimdallarchaeota archaeon]